MLRLNLQIGVQSRYGQAQLRSIVSIVSRKMSLPTRLHTTPSAYPGCRASARALVALVVEMEVARGCCFRPWLKNARSWLPMAIVRPPVRGPSGLEATPESLRTCQRRSIK